MGRVADMTNKGKMMNVFEYPRLCEIRHEFDPDNLVYLWEHKQISDGVRLYWKANDNQNGFYFYSLKITATEGDEDFYEWINPYVEYLLCGVALWDGMRHLHFGDESSDNFGYFYYQKINDLIMLLQALDDLETEFCKEKS